MPLSGVSRQFYQEGRLYIQEPDGQIYPQGSIGLLQVRAPRPLPHSEPEIPPLPIIPSSPPTEAALLLQIDEQKDLLVQNTSLFLTIQYLWEKSYGQPYDYPAYTQLLSEAKALTEEHLKTCYPHLELAKIDRAEREDLFTEKLRTLFFRKVRALHRAEIKRIRQQQLDDPLHPLPSLASAIWITAKETCHQTKFWLMYFKSKVIYFLFSRVIQHYVKSLISNHIKMLREYKQKIQKDDFCSFKNEFIDNLTRCLTILNGAYTSVSKKRVCTGKIQEMVAKELSQSEANLGRTSEMLYRQVADALIISTLGSLKGRAVSFLAQHFCPPGTIVEALVQTIAGSIKDNKGYSHSIHSLALDQLEQIEELLNAQPVSAAPPKPISEEKKRQLSIVIYQLLEILDKSECATVDQLIRVVDGTGFPISVHRRHLETYAMSILMNNIVLMISDLIESNVNETQIDQLTFKVLKLTNESFEPMKVVKEADMAKTEKKLEEVTKRILRKGIDTGFDRSLSDPEDAFGKFYRPRVGVILKKCFWIPTRAVAKKIPLIHSTATEKVQGLLRLLTERNVYICALHHLVLIPYISPKQEKKKAPSVK